MRFLTESVFVKIIFGLTIFVHCALSTALAQTSGKGQQKEILIIGRSVIVDGNIAEARKSAISEALTLGVEAYLMRRLGSQGMINNFPGLIRDVIPKAREEVENFNILAEEQQGKNYKILVRLKINDNVMEEKLREIGFISIQGPPIKILFLVSQIGARENEVSYWWHDPQSSPDLTPTEVALHRVFQERGLNPISRLLNTPEEEYSSEMKAKDLTDADAVKWGRVYGAKVVIHGKCEILKDREVYVTLSALDVEKGNLIYMDAQPETIDKKRDYKEGILESIEKAVSEVAVRMVPPIIRAVEEPETRLSRLEMTLRGMKNFKNFTDYRAFLKREIDGVKSVRQTRIRGNAISFLVEYEGDENTFLDLVTNHENL
jgi:hypothetical protein